MKLKVITLIILALIFLTISADFGLNFVSTKADFQRKYEKGFFEGQRKALKGDIRIVWNDSLGNHWNWIKAPLDDKPCKLNLEGETEK